MDKEKVIRTAYKMMIISTICTLCTHVSYTWSVLSASLKAQNGWTNLQASLPYTIGTMTSGATAVLGGLSSDGKKPGKMALFGALLVGLGLCVVALFNDNLILICIGYGLMVQCGQNFSNVGLPNAALKWVPTNIKGKTAGLCTVGASLSSLLISVLFTFYTDKFGLKFGLICLAITLATIACIAASQFKPAPKEVIEMNKSDTAEYKVTKTPHEDLTIKQCLMTKEFWMINFSWFIVMSANLAVVSQTVSMVNSFSSVALPSWLFVATGGIVGAFGRFFFGSIGDRVGVIKMMAILSGVFGGCLLVFPNLSNPITLFICYAIIQFVISGMNSTIFAAYGLIFGTKHNGVMSGLNGTGYILAGILGPTIASLFKDNLDTYYPAFILFGVTQFIAVFVFMSVHKWLTNYNKSLKENKEIS